MVENGKVTSLYAVLEFYELMKHNYQPNQEAGANKQWKREEFNHANYQCERQYIEGKQELAFCWLASCPKEKG